MRLGFLFESSISLNGDVLLRIRRYYLGRPDVLNNRGLVAEHFIEPLIRESAVVTEDPMEATLFYVPAPLANMYLNGRNRARCKAAEKKILARLRELKVPLSVYISD